MRTRLLHIEKLSGSVATVTMGNPSMPLPATMSLRFWQLEWDDNFGFEWDRSSADCCRMIYIRQNSVFSRLNHKRMTAYELKLLYFAVGSDCGDKPDLARYSSNDRGGWVDGIGFDDEVGFGSFGGDANGCGMPACVMLASFA